MDNHGAGLLHLAAFYNKYESIDCLLELGLDGNLIDSNGQTIYHYAYYNNDVNLLNICKKYSLHDDVLDIYNLAPIDYVTKHLSFIKILVLCLENEYNICTIDNTLKKFLDNGGLFSIHKMIT